MEKILEYLILGRKRNAKVWIIKLVSSGFRSEDGLVYEQWLNENPEKLEKELRSQLGVKYHD